MKTPMNLSQKFPVLRTGIYANTATCGPLSEDLLDWRQEHDLDFLVGASKMKAGTATLLGATRDMVGDFFGCDSDNVALVPNFTIGLNLLLEGLSKKERVLLLQEDYPSLNWPFESRGFDLFFVSMGKQLEERIYEKISSERITVFACSAVQWQNGLKIDLEFLQRLKKDFSDLMVIVDGTQFCGMFAFDFAHSGIDVLGASGYKWMLSGHGNGFIMVKEGVKERFSLCSSGFGSGRNIKSESAHRTFCKHLEPGHLDSLCFGSLQFSLKFLRDIGKDAIDAHNRELSQKVKELFTEMGLLEEYIVEREEHSTIFNISGDDRSFQRLRQNGVMCAQRGGGIRLSFHCYNTYEEVVGISEMLKN